MRSNYAANEDREPLPERTDGLPLFDQPVGYQRFSDTSREAAEAIQADAAHQRARVLAAYKAAGDVGLSADQCAALLDLSVLACRPRVSELFMAGLLVKTDRKATNASGLSARILRIR